MTINTDTTLEISGKKIENIDYDTSPLTFQEYALQDLETGLPATIIHYLTQPPYSIGQGTAEFVEPAFTESIIAHYEGNEGSPSSNTSFIIFTLYLTGYGYIAEGLESIWDDFAPDDWNTVIDLNNYSEKKFLDITVFLEGSFNGSTMNTKLNPEFLPVDQPYLSLPWMYTGLESIDVLPDTNIVDWVLIELRDAADAPSAYKDTKISRQVAWLLSDGSVMALDGVSSPAFTCSPENQLFAVVWHRNHLGVISAFPLNESGEVYSYDFSVGAEQAYGGGLAQKEIATGIWGMIGGDGNADCEIDYQDKNNFWSIWAGQSGYQAGDYNLDGNVQNIDKNDLWRINLNNESQVPE